MPLLSEGEQNLLQQNIEPFQVPFESPLNFEFNDPFCILPEQMKAQQVQEDVYNDYLSIDDDLFLKKYLNIAVVGKQVENSAIFSID